MEDYNSLENKVLVMENQVNNINSTVNEIKTDLKQLTKEIHNGYIDKKMEGCLQKHIGKIVLSSIAGAGGAFGIIELITKFMTGGG